MPLALSRSFARLAKRPGGRLPRQQPPDLIANEYARAIVALTDGLLSSVIDDIKRSLPSLALGLKPIHMDSSDRLRLIIERAKQATKPTDSAARVIVDRTTKATSEFQRAQLSRQVRAKVGIDLPFGKSIKEQRVKDHFANESLKLIQDINDSKLKKIDRAIVDGFNKGKSTDEIAADIEKIGLAPGRANVIAQDQTGTLYGRLNAVRQQDLGISRFVWVSQRDARVRDLHDEIDGNEYSYSDGGHPTEGLPGEPIACRCYAEPVMSAITDHEGPVGLDF